MTVPFQVKGDAQIRHSETTYNRLVRDRIPEIIELMGNVAIWHELDEEAFQKALQSEIVRTSQQFANSDSLEALSDLLETVDAWLDLHGLTMEEVARARAERRKRCGAYDRRTFLECVADGGRLDKQNAPYREAPKK